MSLSDLLASTVSSAPHVLLESMPRVTTSKFVVLYLVSNRNTEQIVVVRVHLDNSLNKIMESASQQSHHLVCFFLFSSHAFRPSQTLEKQSISLWEKHFVCWKIFCKMRTCRSTAIEYKLRIFVHHFSTSKSQHCTIWADKSAYNISVAHLLVR